MIQVVATSGVSPLPAWWVSFVTWASHLGVCGLLVFVSVYVLATICFVPGWILKVGAGFAFGVAKGAILSLAGSLLGAAATFFISRHLAREALRRRYARTNLIQVVDQAIGRKGARLAFLLRLCPIIPASALNYLFGLTMIRFKPYLLATSLGMLPGILFYVYLGDASRAGLETVMHHRWGMSGLIVWGLGAAAAFVILIEVIKSRRQEPHSVTAPPTREPDAEA